MKRPPYSLHDAQKICDAHQHLVGQSFGKDNTAVIECVTIVPFDKINKERFLIFYFLFNNAQSALAHEYRGMLYDVLVIARSLTDRHELLQEDLIIWLADNGQSETADVRHSAPLAAAIQ